MVNLRTPWVFQDLVQELDRMSRDVGLSPAPLSGQGESISSEWTVKDDTAYLVLDLPGVQVSDLDLAVENQRLKIEASREESLHETEEVLLRERSFGTFSRTYRLPWPVNEADVEAELTSGVLKVKLKRAPQAAPRKIEVKTK